MPKEDRTKTYARLQALLVGVALAGSIWSLASTEGCFGCGEKGALTGRLPLANIGTAYYAVLLLVTLPGKWPRLAALGIQSAAGVHLALLGLLAWNRLFCPPCVLSGVGALGAATFTLLQKPRRLKLAMLVLPVAILATLGVAEYSRYEAKHYRFNLARRYAVDAAEELGSPPPGQVYLFHWTRPGCGTCELYETRVIPWAQGKFGTILKLSSKSTTKVGLPTPVVVVIGEQSVFFPMIPLPSELERAVRVALGQIEFDPKEFTRGHPLDVDLASQ